MYAGMSVRIHYFFLGGWVKPNQASFISKILSTQGWLERPPALHARHDSSKSSRRLEIVASLLVVSSPCSTSVFHMIFIGFAVHRLQAHSTTQIGHPVIIALVAQDRALKSVMKSFKIPALQKVRSQGFKPRALLQASILLGDVTGSSFSSGTDLGGVIVLRPLQECSVFVPVFGLEHPGRKKNVFSGAICAALCCA